MKRYLPLIIWVVVIIYPSTTFLERTPSGSLLNLAYNSEAAHVVTHIFVYAVLTLLLVYSFRLLLNWKTVLIALVFTLLVGILQESLQYIVSADRIFGLPEIFDLGANLFGGLLGLTLLYLRGLRGGPHEI